MGRQKPEYNGTSWADIAECIPAWEAEHHVRVEVVMGWDARLSTGAYVECSLWRGSHLGGWEQVVKTRGAFPTRKGSGHPGAVLHTIFQAFAELERAPWLWSPEQRALARGE